VSDIKQRLQQWGEYNCEHLPSHTEELLQEAADHIAALEARNARLEEQVREAYERCAEVAEGEKYTQAYSDASYSAGDQKPQIYNDACDDIAQAIRTLTTEQANG